MAFSDANALMNIPLECQMAGGFCRNCLQELEGERER